MVCFSRKYVAAILPDISFQARILTELFYITSGYLPVP
jgi:hypothetical protein